MNIFRSKSTQSAVGFSCHNVGKCYTLGFSHFFHFFAIWPEFCATKEIFIIFTMLMEADGWLIGQLTLCYELPNVNQINVKFWSSHRCEKISHKISNSQNLTCRVVSGSHGFSGRRLVPWEPFRCVRRGAVYNEHSEPADSRKSDRTVGILHHFQSTLHFQSILGLDFQLFAVIEVSFDILTRDVGKDRQDEILCHSKDTWNQVFPRVVNECELPTHMYLFP